MTQHNRSARGQKSALKNSAQRPDFVILFLVLGLLIFGLIMIYDASIVSATRDFGDKYYYIKDQLKWISVGLVAMVVTMFLDYHIYKKLALPIIITCLVLLIMVFLPVIGVTAYGAHRWLDFKIFIVQPGELMKISLAIFLAAWFADKDDFNSFRHNLIPVVILMGVIGLLILKQPDLGTFIIIAAMALIVYFAAGARLLYYAIGIPLAGLVGLGLILTSTYRKARLTTFLNPTLDPQGQSYHINQILLALGSGGIFGSGIGQSRGKYDFIPEVTTDSIFAVIGEELGFVGALVLISAFVVLLWRGFKVVQNASDRFGKLLALAIVSLIGIQVTFNIASMVVLVPLTGIPLPFISYGGSGTVVMLIGVGILLNISRFSSKPNR